MGAVVAMLVVSGHTVEEVSDRVLHTPYDKVLCMDVGTLVSQYGLDDGASMTRYLDSILEEKLGKPRVTFSELQRITGRRFCVAVHDIIDDAVAYLTPDSAPDVPVAAGVLMSMSLPPLFSPQKLVVTRDSAGNVVRYDKYSRRRHAHLPCPGEASPVPLPHGDAGAFTRADSGTTAEVHLVMDGGCVDNFPVCQFPEATTMGMRVLWTKSFKMDNAQQYFSRIAYCALNRSDAAQWDSFSKTRRANTVSIDVGDIGTVNWTLTNVMRRTLFSAGYRCVMQAFGVRETQHPADAFSLIAGLLTTKAMEGAAKLAHQSAE